MYIAPAPESVVPPMSSERDRALFDVPAMTRSGPVPMPAASIATSETEKSMK